MSKFRDFIARQIIKTVQPQMAQNYIGAPSFRYKNPALLDFCETDEYASTYPSINAISKEFMKVRPFAVGADGEKQQDVQVINALYHPNQLDSSVAFREKLAVMNLTHKNTYILVWRREGNEAVPGGDIRADNIAGFTFLENPGISRLDGRTYYNIGAQEFNDKEVIVIPGGVDPRNLYGGYAPGISSARWAKLDQYIADFQNGFLENGAVPAGQFVITARTKKDFEDTVDKLQDAHRGASKNNNVVYTPRPVDPQTDKPANAKIEWIPFQQSNKEIDFKNIFEQANKRIDSTFGVPASIRGVGENNNYATARVDQQNFIRFTIEPLALRIYTQITHELNRITGGLGVGITFELEYPAVADEEKVQAETKKVETDALMLLIDKGYSLESAVDALALPERYKKLSVGDLASGDPDEDDPDVDDGSEVDESPDPEEIDGVTPIRNIFNALPQTDVDQYETQMEVIIRNHMQKDVNKAVDENVEDATEEETEEFTEDMMEVITLVLIAAGILQYADGQVMLAEEGIDIGNTSQFTLSELQEEQYRAYLTNVAQSYRNDTAKSVRSVLERGEVEGWDADTLKANLRNIMNTDEWRVKRLATSEINRSQDMGSIYSMRQIEDETEAEIERSLLHTGSDAPCEYCKAYIDNWSPVGKSMIKKNQIIEGTAGGLMVYTWDNNEGHDVHANGHCVPQYRVAS